MPIFEYTCRTCHHQFEAIVRASDTPRCPDCASADLERLISMFAVDSSSSRSLALGAARQRHAKETREKAHADSEYDRKHRHE